MASNEFKYRNPELIDIRTDYGKGIRYKSEDGREWATIEQVEQANKEYWDSIMIKPKGRGR